MTPPCGVPRSRSVLVPSAASAGAFSQRSMKAYYPQMLEIAERLVASWASRQGEDLPVSDDMTRLTLDVPGKGKVNAAMRREPRAQDNILGAQRTVTLEGEVLPAEFRASFRDRR